MQHLEKFDDGLIVETGTCRNSDIWEGDGCSTRIWNWVLENSKLAAYSVDIDSAAVAQSKVSAPLVEISCMDSVQFMESLDDSDLARLRLLYLDSFDWSPEINMQSSFHHMAELAAVWAKVPAGCLIVVDDRHSDTMGKHFLVERYMEKLGIKPSFVGYQIGWIRP